MSETLETPLSPSHSESVWDERQLRHVREAIFRAPLRKAPSEHLYVENFFSTPAYAEILRLFPTDPQAFRRYHNPGPPGMRFGNYMQRQEINIPAEADRLPAEQAAFWTAFSAMLCGPEFARTLLERFESYARARLGDQLDDPSFIDRRIRGTMILNQHDPDYYLGPHTDRGEKLFTCVFYFPEREGLEHLGTTLYRPLERDFTCTGLAHHDPARFERRETMPYRANSALVFARTDVMFHGVHRLTAEELRGSRRRGIQMQFYVLNERPREECKVTFTMPIPTMMRAGSDESVPYRLTNRSTTELLSTFPFTTQLGYRWFDAAGHPVDPDSSVGTELPGALAPGESKEGSIRVIAPQQPGRYLLRASVVQTNVAWFDDIDPDNGSACFVTVWDADSLGSPAANPSGGIAPAAIRTDILPDSHDIALGDGWYPLERESARAFRWVENDAVINVAALRTLKHTLHVRVAPGPGVGQLPFELSARVLDGPELGKVIVASEHVASFTLPAESPRIFSIVLHAAGGGKPNPNDPRMLNFRVFDIAVERVADVFPAWAIPEEGFYAPERDESGLFRWATAGAQIDIGPVHDAALIFGIESGPGFACRPFTLHIDGPRGELAAIDVAARATVSIPLAAPGEAMRLRLRADGGGLLVDGDPRRLDFRIFAHG